MDESLLERLRGSIYLMSSSLFICHANILITVMHCKWLFVVMRQRTHGQPFNFAIVLTHNTTFADWIVRQRGGERVRLTVRVSRLVAAPVLSWFLCDGDGCGGAAQGRSKGGDPGVKTARLPGPCAGWRLDRPYHHPSHDPTLRSLMASDDTSGKVEGSRRWRNGRMVDG